MRRYVPCVLGLGAVVVLSGGCRSAESYRAEADRVASGIIDEKQQLAFGRTEPFTIERPEIALREKLIREQGLQVSVPASVGSQELDVPEHWPADGYLESARVDRPIGVRLAEGSAAGLVTLSLEESLAVAALNSRAYQSAKERVFLTALSLDLARDEFRWSGEASADGGLSADLDTQPEETLGATGGAQVGLSRQFRNGAEIAGAIGVDLARLFTLGEGSSLSLFGDASISVPLLRGSGEHIVTEPLTQAERDAVYAIYEFERFKRVFAVNVASSYLNVLGTLDQVNNAEQNYRSLIAAARQLRRLADFGRRPETQVDQAVQDELQARAGWIRAQQSYQSSLDSFLSLLGLPPDANVELKRDDLERLGESVGEVLDIPEPSEVLASRSARPPVDADAPIELDVATRDGGGPLELEERVAVGLALRNRLDLRTVIGEVFDAQRGVIVAADGLRAEVTLLGSASFGETRGLGGAELDDSRTLRPDLARYEALLTIDLPIERTAERNVYRASFIELESSVRDLQDLEDSIKAQIRGQLRTLLESREGLQIQATAVALAERRVESTRIFLDEGRAETRDLLEAQDDLLSAQNALTSALVDYRVAELELQRDMGVLAVDELSQWTEFDAAGAGEPRFLFLDKAMPGGGGTGGADNKGEGADVSEAALESGAGLGGSQGMGIRTESGGVAELETERSE